MYSYANSIIVIDIDTKRVLEFFMVNLRCYEDPTRNKKLSIKEIVDAIEVLVKKTPEMEHVFCRDDCKSCASKGPAIVIVEEQMPTFASKGNIAYSNFIIQAVSLAFIGPSRCSVIGAEKAKMKFAEDFPILASTKDSSKRNKFNKKNAMALESKILNSQEKEAIDTFDWNRHHHMIDSWLLAEWAVDQLAGFQYKKINGLSIVLPSDDESDDDDDDDEECIVVNK